MRPLDALQAGLGGGLIEASAGTGKTYTITTLFLRLLVERELTVGEILVVTFTTAATAELRDRIRSRIRQALAAFDGGTADDTLAAILATRGGDREPARGQLQAALRDFDEAAIFTIHGLCQRILQNHAFESGVSFDAELVTNQDHLLTEVVSDYWGDALYGASTTWVRHVVAQGLTADSLIELAKIAVADPAMPVLPAAVDVQALEALDAAIEMARLAAAAIWSDERERVLALLKPLNAAKYKGLPGWPPIMDAVLAGTHPGGVTGFSGFHRFTSAGIADGLKKGQAMPSHPFFAACDKLHAAAQRAAGAVNDQLIAFRRDLIAYARREVPRRKEATRTLGFDDLLQRLDAALDGPGGPLLARTIRGIYKVALIDELQDTDPVQYRIFRAVYGGDPGAGMFLIGDPKQAIYSFRGADVFAYLRAARDAQGHSFTLDTNYRSDPALIRAVNALFSRAHAPFLMGNISFTAAKPAPAASERLHGGNRPAAPLRILFAKRDQPDGKPITKGWADRFLPAAVAADVARLLQSGATIEGRAVSAGDVAVLVRKNAQAERVQEALRELRVPSVLQGDASVFDAPEALEVQRVLAAMADPSGSGAVRLGLSTSLFALDANGIHALEHDDATWDLWVSRFGAWGKRWEENGFVAAFRQLLDQQEAAPRLLRLVDGERRLTNLLHLAELLHVAASREHLGPAGLLRWLSAMRRDTDARERFGTDAAQVRLESDDHAVKLVTIHKSKGLQYPIVYCPYLWDGKLLRNDAKEALRFHDPKNDDRHTLDLGSASMEDHWKHAEREAAAENLRLLYVALTRAKHQVVVVWGNFTDANTSPLGYLLHQGPGAAGDLFAPTAERVKKLDDNLMLQELFELSASASGAIGVESLSPGRGEVYTPPAGSADELRGREATRTIERWWRTSSFTSLVSGAGSDPAREAEGRDRDAREAMLRRESLAATPPSVDAATPVLLHAFPRGARPGELIHKVFEVIDFTAPEADIARSAERWLGRYRFSISEWKDVLAMSVCEVLATPLHAPGEPAEVAFTLAQVPREKRMNELEFIFPLDARGGETEADRLLFARGALADAFTAHARAPIPADYADQLRQLPFSPFAGFLRGFVDLVFEHGGRYYVVDYKSNHLGPAPADYAERLLPAAMSHAHYILQYHLYVVALHRYLAHRLSDYSYDRHFGGVFYLFVRGMAPERGMATGVFADRPPRALIEALSSLFAGEPGAGGRGGSASAGGRGASGPIAGGRGAGGPIAGGRAR